MKIKSILLTDLSVNNANDRHGELVDDGKAMEWLLKHRADHMKNLAIDIVKESGIYEPPLVHEEKGAFTVYDGNRRVTCLKLLDKPTLAATESWRDFFQTLRSEWVGTFPTKIECQVETNKDRIDEILFRRHTGVAGGVGQSPWDPIAKSNFVKRSGKKSRVSVAEEIEKKLKEGGYLKLDAKVPRSNINRLLSSEGFRNRVGISVKDNHLELTHDENVVMTALTRIAHDFVTKEIVLEDVWSNKSKKEYLDLLDTEDVLPKATDSLTTSKSFKALKTKKTSTKKASTTKPKKRKNLIRADIDYGVLPQVHTQRAMDVWGELQHHLEFGKHDNAIAVSFRVLVEFAVESYITRQSVSTVHTNDSLGKKFRKSLDHMLAASSIDKKYHEGLKKFENTEPVLSANTMNKYVHHKSFFPSDHHLKSMWDTMSEFITVCLKA